MTRFNAKSGLSSAVQPTIEKKHPQNMSLAVRVKEMLFLNTAINIPHEKIIITDTILGAGTDAAVLLAKRSGFDAHSFPMVIKAFNPSMLSEKEQREKIQREIEMMSTLNPMYSTGSYHPFIRLYGAFDDAKRGLCIVMEYASGGTLHHLIHNNTIITSDLRTRIALQMFSGLEIMQQQHIIHCDLKSENILLDEEHNVKIADFGSALHEVFDHKKLSPFRGSVPYAAPELLNDKAHSFQSDVYSVGIILWELAARKIPFEAIKHYFTLRNRIAQGRKPTFLALPGDLPFNYRQVVKNCLETVPEKRPTPLQVYRQLNNPVKLEKPGVENKSNRLEYLNLSSTCKNQDIKNLANDRKKLSSNSLAKILPPGKSIQPTSNTPPKPSLVYRSLFVNPIRLKGQNKSHTTKHTFVVKS